MKKKMMLLAAMFMAMSMFLSGCIQFVIDFTVKADKSGEFGMTVGLSTPLLEQMEVEDPTEAFGEIVESANDNGWSLENYKNDKYTGVIVKGTISDCTDEAAMKDSVGALMKFEETTTDGKKGMKVSITSEDFMSMLASEAGAKDLSDLKEFGDLDIAIKVTLPYPVTEHNGTSLSSDKKTVTWNLMETKDSLLSASCVESAKGGIPILPIVIVIVVIVAIRAFMKKK